MGCIASSRKVLTDFHAGGDVLGRKSSWTVRTNSTRKSRPTFTGSQDPGHLAKLRVLFKVELFRPLSDPQKDDVIQSAEDCKYNEGECITAQGEVSTTFYAIKWGEVDVFVDGEKVRSLGKGNFFGERALLIDEPSMSTTKAVNGPVHMWYIDRESFIFAVHGQMMQQMLYNVLLQDLSITLDGLQTMGLLGQGAFGRVDMVQCRRTGLQYALKACKKDPDGSVPAQLEQEVELLRMTDNQFLMKLVKTFESKDEFHLLTELITGCQLYSAIRMISKALSRIQAQFYVGCLVLAIEALHSKDIVYRDLKPENVMLDAQGYPKIVDFGTAKRLERRKTFSVVGTPHYMAPEIIRRRGYGFAVDLWSIGVILFELVCGFLPFGNTHDEPDPVCRAVVHESLLFPVQYEDEDGKDFMSQLLTKTPADRLGSGMMGFEDVKNADWFVMVDEADAEDNDFAKDLFSLLIGRELIAPITVDGVRSMKKSHVTMRRTRSSLSVASSMMTKSLRMESVASRRSTDSAFLSTDAAVMSSGGMRPWLSVKPLSIQAPPPPKEAFGCPVLCLN
mmetsp:Transcript_8181/g.18249  ORF Transcript_8181/g.18249 Transcript_8181/m.18249 type:complete len:562 (+) Transcript_8181:131-1816(+)